MMDEETDELFVNSGYHDEESDDEEFTSNDHQHGKMLSEIAAMDGKKRDKPQRSEPNKNISEYNLSELNREKVKVYELLASLRQDENNKDLKKQIKSAGRQSTVLPTPLPKPEAEKIKRNLAYTKVGQEVEKWDSVVDSNRVADHLEFPLKKSRAEIGHTIDFTKNFKPKTPLELEIAQLLSNSENVFTEERELTVAEEKALKAMNVEEARERLAEMRKMRVLLSYQEAKARRNRKIKSKRFHRVLKKERLKNDLKAFEELKEVDPELAAEKFKTIDKLRIEERMTLRHKSTGKWAKHRQIRAKYDKESRDALSTQLDFSHQLTEKQRVSLSSSESEENDEIEENCIKEEEDTLELNANPAFVNLLIAPISNYNPWMKDSIMPNLKNRIKRKRNEKKNPIIIRKMEAAQKKSTIETGEEEIEFDLASDDDDDGSKSKVPVRSNGSESTVLINKRSKPTQKEKKLAARKRKRAKSLNGNKTPSVEKQNKEIEDSSEELADQNGLSKTLMKSEVPLKSNRLEATVPVNKSFKPTLKEKKLAAKKRKRAESLKGNKTPSVEKQIEKISNSKEIEDNSEELGDEDGLSETLVKRNTMEDLENIEVTVSKANPKVIPSVPVIKKAEVRIDPRKFVMAKTKALHSHLPELMDQGDDELEDAYDDLRISIAEAFADDNVIEEFSQEKQKVIDENTPKAVNLALPGWGSWGGVGLKIPKYKIKKFTIPSAPALPRKDHHLGHVIINEKMNDKLKPHQVSSVPQPFAKVAQFEQLMRHPIGNTWNPETSFRKMIVPPITTKRGEIIDPIDADAIIMDHKKVKDQKKNQPTRAEKITF